MFFSGGWKLLLCNFNFLLPAQNHWSLTPCIHKTCCPSFFYAYGNKILYTGEVHHTMPWGYSSPQSVLWYLVPYFGILVQKGNRSLCSHLLNGNYFLNVKLNQRRGQNWNKYLNGFVWVDKGELNETLTLFDKFRPLVVK